MIPLSVVIAARNAEQTIREQIIALTSQQWPNGGEIIVADNGSTDSTVQIVLEEILQLDPDGNVSVHIVNCGEVPGAGHARNAGVRVSRFPHVAFCDADDIVTDGWIEAMGSALTDHPAVGGRLALDQLNPKEVRDSRGSSLDGSSLPTFDGVFPVLSSCNFGMDRATFETLGGFDESYLRGQDAELSLRMHERGITVHFAPDAVVQYRLANSSTSIFRQAQGWGQVNDRLRARLPERPRLTASLRSWLWLGAHLHHLADPERRARWVYVAGIRIGLVRGGIRRHLGRSE